ncbi:uncharacterized protein C2845_PM06G16940 [Panicum miliaceum]|uniref:Uncharacterized protein n=1 Tax=Panicum miliaceum TaxID=4540 RepID=A0A3L6RD61_PANMI|nr:uncharacterized protein C2845_PM06G16940 [Panicum miliaceum]
MPLPLEAPLPPGGDVAFALLRRKLAGARFHDADIYAADPATLTAAHRPAPPARKGEGGSWFFFTHVRPKSASDSRKSRRARGTPSARPGACSTASATALATASTSRTSAGPAGAAA